MFGRRKEELVTQWQEASWNGVPGYAKNSNPENKSDEWDFSVRVPEDADSSTVVLGYSSGPSGGDGGYTLSYRVVNALAWNLMKLDEITGDNYLKNFSAHATVEDLTKAVGPSNINRHPTNKLDL